MTSQELAAVELEQEAAAQEARKLLGQIQTLVQYVDGVRSDLGAGPKHVLSARSAALERVREARVESRGLAKQAAEAAKALQSLAHKADLAGGSGGGRFAGAQELSGKLLSDSNSMRDFLEEVSDGMMVEDRAAILESERRATAAARNHIEATVLPPPRPGGMHSLASRREVAEEGPAAAAGLTEEKKLVVVAAQRKRPAYEAASALALANPAAGDVPIGMAMAGEPSMPTGWVIPGPDASMHWMWAQLTILGTDKVIVLPIRRCDVMELTEAMGKMLGRSHEDFKLFVKQGCHTKRLLPTDQVPARVFVKGITSWERQRQTYNHPFAIIGAGHMGLRQALECLAQKVEDFVLFERLDKVGGESWLRMANGASRLQTEFGTYHLNFFENLSAHPVPALQQSGAWPTRDEILNHFQDVAAEHGVLPHLRLQTAVTGVKIEKMSRLQMLEEGKGDSDPNAQHYKLALQKQEVFEGLSCDLAKASAKGGKEKKDKAKGGDGAAAEGAATEGASEEGAGSAAAEKSSFLASSVMAFPGSLHTPRDEAFKGEEQFGGHIAHGLGGQFDYEKASGKLVAICGMGSVAIENVRTCLENDVQSCYIVCRRKNLTMPRAVSWFINQSSCPAPASEVLSAVAPMYAVAGEDVFSYDGVSPSAASIYQNTRMPVSDFFFLALYYGRCEIVVGEIKRLMHQMMILEDGRKLEVNCILKAFGCTASFEMEALLHSSKMFGYWPDADFRRWIFCESVGADFMQISTTSLSPLAMRVAAFPLHFLAFPKPDFKDLVDAGSMHWNSPDAESNQPAFVISARDSMYIIGLVVSFAPALQEQDIDTVRRRRQLQSHPTEAFLKQAAMEWASYCQLLRGDSGQEPPEYPYPLAYMKDLVSKSEKEGKRRMATGSAGVVDEGETRTWNPYLKLFC